VITAAYYLLFRLWFYVITPLSPEHLANFLGVLGSGAILWGGWCALQQERVKLVLAYSTVSQVGYLFLVFALTVQREESQGLAWAGAVGLALSHGLAKAGAFLAASSLLAATGSDRLDALRGVARRYPMAAMTFALAAVSLMGLPPTGGFIGKWMLLKAVVMNGQWGYAFVIIAGGLLAACYLFRVLECFVDAPEGTKRAVPGIPFWQLLPAFCLALLAIGLALGVAWPMELLKVDAPVTFITQVVTEVPNP
jgi:formate hydrogenlyase subunit 3/multisubunit Na+/H+ antiporter MnhD subunit